MLRPFATFDIGRPDPATLEQLVEASTDARITYSPVGGTLTQPVAGSRPVTRTASAGSGPATFAAARDAITSWAGHRAMNMILEPATPPLVEGATMAFAMPMRPLPIWVTGACRVMQVVDEPRRFGFAYGTLPHHPESGEEAFLVHHLDDDVVEFEVTAFSEPQDPVMALAGPVGRGAQRLAMGRYLKGFVEATQLKRG